MPELPEVETLRRGLMERVVGRILTGVVIRRTDLRFPVPGEDLERFLPGQVLEAVERRAKYLLLKTGAGTVIVHLGMSGTLQIVASGQSVGRHDHLDFLMDDNYCLRLTDPRRFGAVLWGGITPCDHPLLARLGPEPLSDGFDGRFFFNLARGRVRPVKSVLMDSRVVSGIGNIYAVESLFMASVHPAYPVGKLNRHACQQITDAVKDRLAAAIEQGGTTLKDFRQSNGKPGYFQQFLRVYGREGKPCLTCATPVASFRLGGRASPFCPKCQPWQ